MKNLPWNLLRLLRPHQWLKNAFVLVGVLFGHAWDEPDKLLGAAVAFAAFCLLASGTYVMNDIADREQDRRHPKKRQRPLASGVVALPAAVALMVGCFAAAAALVYAGGSEAPWLFVLYLLLNIGYTLGWKHVVVLDVFLLAAGFMLRILAGTLGVGIAPSQWLLLCGLMLTLFLGFAKRHAELQILREDRKAHRRVLEHYSHSLLDQMMSVAAAGTIVSYSLYTVSAETVALHGTTALIYTVPFVLYGMFRYLFLLHRRGGGGDPALELLGDPHLLGSLLGWLAAVILLLSQA